MRGELNDDMRAFVGRMEMMFVATSDARGECDCTIRCGPAGFVRVLDARTLAWPEYRGNGVMASLGNVSENAHAGLLFVDLVRDCIGLHINGTAAIVESETLLARQGVPSDVFADCELRGGRRPERWVVISVHEAYIHCAKHLPLMSKLPKRVPWGTDDARAKGGDYFQLAGPPSDASAPSIDDDDGAQGQPTR